MPGMALQVHVTCSLPSGTRPDLPVQKRDKSGLFYGAKRYEKIHNKIFCYFRASHAAGVHAVLHRAVYHGHWAFVYEVHRHYERKVGWA